MEYGLPFKPFPYPIYEGFTGGVKTEMVSVKSQPTKEKGKVRVWMMVSFGFSYMYVHKVYSALISVMGSFTRLRSPLTVVVHLGFTI
jgi:hypothetical protein